MHDVKWEMEMFTLSIEFEAKGLKISNGIESMDRVEIKSNYIFICISGGRCYWLIGKQEKLLRVIEMMLRNAFYIFS